MLLDARTPSSTGWRFDQLRLRMQGSVDVSALERALQAVTERHAVLRSAFQWEGLKAPVQVIHSAVKADFQMQDLRSQSAQAQRDVIDRFQKSDKASGFTLTRPPLLRVQCFVTADDVAELVISYLPCVLDGWSVAVVMREFLGFYEAAVTQQTTVMEPAPPYRTYAVWLKGRDEDASRRHWSQVLAGFDAPTPIPVDRLAPPQRGSKAPPVVSFDPGAAFLEALKSTSRHARVTVNSLVQAAWAAVLQHISGQSRVLYTTAISGRPADVDEIDAMAGVFFNNIPVGVTVADRSLAALAQDIQAQLSAAGAHSHISPAQIQSWSGFAPGVPLAHSLVLFHNFPLQGTFWDTRKAFSISGFEKPIHVNVPLSLVCIPELSYQFQLIFDAALWDEKTAEAILSLFRDIMERACAAPDRALSALCDALPQISAAAMLASRVPPSEAARQPDALRPEAGLEQDIAAAWESVLGLKNIGRNENFFDLGGRSFQIAMIKDQLHNLGHAISLTDIFEFPTVGQLAAYLSGRAAATAPQPPAPRVADAQAGRRRRGARMRQARDA